MKFEAEYKHCNTKMIFNLQEYENVGYLECPKCKITIQVSFYISGDKDY